MRLPVVSPWRFLAFKTCHVFRLNNSGEIPPLSTKQHIDLEHAHLSAAILRWGYAQAHKRPRIPRLRARRARTRARTAPRPPLLGRGPHAPPGSWRSARLRRTGRGTRCIFSSDFNSVGESAVRLVHLRQVDEHCSRITLANTNPRHMPRMLWPDWT